MDLIYVFLGISIIVNISILINAFKKKDSDGNTNSNSNNVVLDFMIVANDEILIVPTFPKNFEFDRKNKTLVLCALHDFKEKILNEGK